MSRASLVSLFAAVVLTACSAPTKIAAPPATPTAATPVDPTTLALPLWSEIKKGTLKNGLTYYILPHHKPEKRALFWLAINAGSVQEDDDQRGLAHFDEHMAFNGTKHFPKSAIVDYLEKIGMRFGADLNAYTSFDQTVYQLEVPTDKAELTGKGLDILRDWASDVSYDPTEVDKERGVVKEEWRLHRGAAQRLRDKQLKVVLAGTRYAERDTIGLPDTIDHAPRDVLARFYKDWYRPDLMAVIAVGDFDPATIEKEIRARFGDLTAPAKPRPRMNGGVPVGKGTRISIETDKEAPAAIVNVSNLVAHRPLTNQRALRQQTVESLYSQILNQRLQLIARKPGAPFLFARVGIDSREAREVEGFDRFAQAKGDKVEEALRGLLTEVERIERHGVTKTELERARTDMARTLSQAEETEATQDSRQFAEEITRNFFTDELIVGIAAEKAMILKLLPTITTDDLNADLKEFSGDDGRVVLIAGPEGKPLPNKERVHAIIEQVGKTELAPWNDGGPTQPLMPTPPTPGKVVAEKKIDAIGVTEWTLSNGARVIVKPTDYELDNVSISGMSPGGLATVSDKDYPKVRFADHAVDVGGVGELDQEALKRVLTGKSVHVSTAIGEETEMVNGGGSAHDLETMMQLVYMHMTAPRQDAQAFSVWQANFSEQLGNMLRNPEFQSMTETLDALWKGNLRRKIPTAADVASVDLDKSLAVYRDRFGDASDFTFVIVGAIDLPTLKPLVETYLASLPSHGRKEKEKDLHIRKVAGVVEKEWKLGQAEKASVSIDLHREEAWSRDKERDLAILGMVLSIKLRETLREDLGGVYGVSATDDFQRAPYGEHSFEVSFHCDPSRVAELKKATFDLMSAVAKDGADDEVLQKIRETYVRERETSLRKNGFWAHWLTSAYRYRDDPTIILDTSKMTARMTSANVKASAKHYLDTKQYFQAVMMPASARPAP